MTMSQTPPPQSAPPVSGPLTSGPPVAAGQAAPPAAGQQGPVIWSKLESTDFASPVSEFVGILEKEPYSETNNFGNLNIVMEFHNCNVMFSDETYPHTKVKVSIKHSEYKNSGWGVFTEDVLAKFGIKTVDELAAKHPLIPGVIVHLYKQKERVFGYDNKQGINLQGNAWRIVDTYVAGTDLSTVAPVTGTPNAPTGGLEPKVFTAPAPTAGNALEEAITLLHGKTDGEFYAGALAHPVIKGDAGIMAQINGGTFIPTMIASGRIGQNQGRYYKLS